MVENVSVMYADLVVFDVIVHLSRSGTLYHSKALWIVACVFFHLSCPQGTATGIHAMHQLFALCVTPRCIFQDTDQDVWGARGMSRPWAES